MLLSSAKNLLCSKLHFQSQDYAIVLLMPSHSYNLTTAKGKVLDFSLLGIVLVQLVPLDIPQYIQYQAAAS